MLDNYRLNHLTLSPHGNSLFQETTEISQMHIDFTDKVISTLNENNYEILCAFYDVTERLSVNNSKFTEHIVNKILPVLDGEFKRNYYINVLLDPDLKVTITNHEFSNSLNRYVAKDNNFFKEYLSHLEGLKQDNYELYNQVVYQFFLFNARSSWSFLGYENLKSYFQEKSHVLNHYWNRIDFDQLSPVAYWFVDQIENEFKKYSIELKNIRSR